MEYIIALGAVIIGAWWYFTRKPNTVAAPVVEEAPYKVETVETAVESQPVLAGDGAITTDALPAFPAEKPAKAKKATAKKPATARKPRAPKKAK